MKIGFVLPMIVAAIGAMAAQGLSQAASDQLAQSFPLDKELDQGWDTQKRSDWYESTQGSRLIPLDWMRALEQPGTEALFIEPDHIAKFGYLPYRSDRAPKLFALGFPIDTSDDTELVRTKLRWKVGQGTTEPWVGMNCAACHTGQLTYRGATMRIDGGQALADFQSFVESMEQALRETLAEPKWSRFAHRVLGNDADTAENRKSLRGALEQLLAWQSRELAINSVPLRYGSGRVDAFGHIFNKVALLLDEKGAKGNPADAPVSIPFIWRAPQLNRVQYNGIAPKIPILFETSDLGALVRNSGEVIGVFGDVSVNGKLTASGYPSTIRVDNLTALENQLGTLRPPKWPASQFPLDTGLVDEGRKLYAAHCVRCHALVDRTSLRSRIDVEMSLFDGTGRATSDGQRLAAPGTDPWMACNAYDYQGPSVDLAGAFFGAVGQQAPMSELLAGTVGGVLLGKKMDIAKETFAQLFHIPRPPKPDVVLQAAIAPKPPARTPEKQAQLQRCMTKRSANLGYTSRPLNGIWATAPYLHNGSVASLFELLLPPSERKPSFPIGTREFDPVNVGLETAPERGIGDKAFTFKARDADGTFIDGNSNEGHDYGNANLSKDDRKALVEYLKTL
ncbi:hypothetical protein CTI14_00210 [Methylobacterium radiotolerans]|nr:hypothetical protein CTI14_00210 [Methylobacterium radiotolerans]